MSKHIWLSCLNTNLNSISNSSNVVARSCSHPFIHSACNTRELIQKGYLRSIYTIHLTKTFWRTVGLWAQCKTSKRGIDILHLALLVFIIYRDRVGIQHCHLSHSGRAGARQLAVPNVHGRCESPHNSASKDRVPQLCPPPVSAGGKNKALKGHTRPAAEVGCPKCTGSIKSLLPGFKGTLCVFPLETFVPLRSNSQAEEGWSSKTKWQWFGYM